MSKDADTLKIVKEDILRIMGEAKRTKISLRSIKEEINASIFYISKTISVLEDENLIKLEKNFIKPTEKGQKKAENIAKRHLIIENYFRKTKSIDKAHKVTDVLEHYISEEVLNNIKKLSTLKGGDLPLTEFEVNRENLITDIKFSVGGLFERMVSMGILPGEKIRIMYKIPDGFVVNVNRKKIALGKDIAKGIKVLK